MPTTSYSSRHGKPHKTKKELAARIDAKLRQLRLHSGLDEFDPVEMMALIGAEAYDEGDKHLALVAFKEVSQYVRPKLANVQVEAEVEHTVVPARLRSIQMAKQMGLPVARMIEQFAADEGLSVTEAYRVLDLDLPEVAIPGIEDMRDGR